jgi:general stress protein YciG
MAQKSQGTGTSNRGFASMDTAKQREIASKGGQSVPAAKRSFSQDRRLAAEAGRKGGQSSHGGGRSKQGMPESVTTAAGNPAGDTGVEHGEGRETARNEPEKVDH